MENRNDSAQGGEYLDWMYINLRKTGEDQSQATYSFTCAKYREVSSSQNEPAGSATGVVRISKDDGKLTLVEPMPGDAERRVASRAAQVLQRHWSKGEYPETTAHVAG
jgi:hypothetical protein